LPLATKGKARAKPVVTVARIGQTTTAKVTAGKATKTEGQMMAIMTAETKTMMALTVVGVAAIVMETRMGVPATAAILMVMAMAAQTETGMKIVATALTVTAAMVIPMAMGVM